MFISRNIYSLVWLGDYWQRVMDFYHDVITWWRHQVETFSALLDICAGNSPASGEFPAQRPVTRSFDVFFDLCLNKRLRKQSWGWWFETLSWPLWRHYNEMRTMNIWTIAANLHRRMCFLRCIHFVVSVFMLVLTIGALKSLVNQTEWGSWLSYHWPFVRESTGDWWIPPTRVQWYWMSLHVKTPPCSRKIYLQ